MHHWSALRIRSNCAIQVFLHIPLHLKVLYLWNCLLHWVGSVKLLLYILDYLWFVFVIQLGSRSPISCIWLIQSCEDQKYEILCNYHIFCFCHFKTDENCSCKLGRKIIKIRILGSIFPHTRIRVHNFHIILLVCMFYILFRQQNNYIYSFTYFASKQFLFIYWFFYFTSLIDWISHPLSYVLSCVVAYNMVCCSINLLYLLPTWFAAASISCIFFQLDKALSP